MKYIEKLLKGAEVKWMPLGEVAELKRGRVISKEYLYENVGDYPVYSSQTVNNGEIGKINTFDFEQKAITWTTDGANAGTIFYRDGRFSITNICGLITIKDTQILSYKYLYYWLSIEAKKHVYSGMGNPKLMSNQMGKVPIPIPPLAVQEEIARILDKFTTLEAELEAELDCRKRQYEYYRNQLLSLDVISNKGNLNNVEVVTLGEIGTFVRGSGLQKKDFTPTGVGCIHYGQIYTYYGTCADKTKSFVSYETAKQLKHVEHGDVIITNTSENVDDVCKAVVYLGKEPIVTGGHASIFKPSEKIDGKYFAYYTQTEWFARDKRKYAKGTKVIDVSATDLAKIKIPIPSLAEQQRIVSILDKFEALTTSISEGLPKEIALRRKQYEYYRNQLLSFA